MAHSPSHLLHSLPSWLLCLRGQHSSSLSQRAIRRKRNYTNRYLSRIRTHRRVNPPLSTDACPNVSGSRLLVCLTQQMSTTGSACDASSQTKLSTAIPLSNARPHVACDGANYLLMQYPHSGTERLLLQKALQARTEPSRISYRPPWPLSGSLSTPDHTY